MRYKIRCLGSMLGRMAESATDDAEDGFLNGLAFMLGDIDESLSFVEGLL